MKGLRADSDVELDQTGSRGDLVIVVGAEGTSEYGQMFRDWSAHWADGAKRGGLGVHVIGQEPPADRDDRTLLQEALAKVAGETNKPLWLVLIGHGTFDGKNAKFNLRGDDIAALELDDWLSGTQRPLAIVLTFSASAPFMEALSTGDRAIVTATKSGVEANFSRFGEHLSRAIGDLAHDLDKDDQVSLLEAFLAASRKTQEFYDSEGRLATEHPLLDDNGDGKGTRAEAYRGVRLIEKDPGIAWDGVRSHQWHLIPSNEERRLPVELAAQRDALELKLAQLRDLKATLPEDLYYRELEQLLLQIAKIYVSAEQSGTAAPAEATPPASTP